MEESKPENQEENQPKKNLAHREWVDKLVSKFTTTKENEDKIESLRLELNQQNNFSAKSLFEHIDKDSKNFLTFDDFRKFCQENSIKYNDKNLRQFIHNYDKNNDFCINFDEFKGIVFPLTDDSFRKKEEEELEKAKELEKEKEKENNINKSKENNDIDTKENNNDIDTKENKEDENNVESKEKENNNENEDDKEDKKEGEENKDKDGKLNEEEKEKEKIAPNILSKFGEILGGEMELSEKNIENGKNITGAKNFTFYESFREIADEDKYITEENLLNFLKKNGAELEDKDMKGIIHRYDNDNDGKISYIEFKDMLSPPGDAPYKSSYNDYNKYSYNNYDPIRSSNYNNLYNSSPYYPLRNSNYSNPDNNYTNSYNNPESYYPERNNFRNSSDFNLKKNDFDLSTVSNSSYNVRPCCGCPIFYSCCCCCPSYCC